ncbi:DUF397 domain-containing protein [Saccharopolyspora sp. MS10]|uniref:DUF397 domain-containing protein n=1 Tax=Saccharopolyspora sp. MS10 TaxID=3385973 RepID=UPI0039A31670
MRWRKSSHSGEESNCVEVGAVPGIVAVRDSKAPRAATLSFSARQWASFLHALRGRPES